MYRFYIQDKTGLRDRVDIKDAEARHIKDVLRLRIGAQVILFDGSGMEFIGEIAGLGRDLVSVNILEAKEVDTESPIEIILGQGIPKSDKMELIIQKGTELGITKIVPFYTERVVPKSFSPNKLERWQRIAVEACKQSGRVKVPEVSEPVSFEKFVNIIDTSFLKLIPWEEEKEISLKKVLSASGRTNKFALIVGPEGGLTESEVGIAQRAGFVSVSLGKRILRTETVSLVVVPIIQYLYGDLS